MSNLAGIYEHISNDLEGEAQGEYLKMAQSQYAEAARLRPDDQVSKQGLARVTLKLESGSR
jgi:hypothetical protein